MADEFFLFYIHLVLLLSVHDSSVEAKDLSITRSGCQDRCGNIPIPFPFGIGKGCYKDEWHEIKCNHNHNGAVASLSRIPLEVLNITLPGDDYNSRIVVKSPVISAGCSSAGGSDVVSLNLTGSPFVISNVNTFIALGCKSTWLLTNVEPEVAGCRTTCDKTIDNGGDIAFCKGYKCCNASIPNDLQVFGAERENHSGSQGCQLAFLSHGSFSPPKNASDGELLRKSKMSNKVVLEWGIFGTSVGMDTYGTIKCKTRSSSWTSVAFIFCRCRRGYRGNPYLHGGCKDDRGVFYIVWPITLGVGIAVEQMFLSGAIWWSHNAIGERKRMELKKKFFKRNGGLLLLQQLSSLQGNIERIKIFSPNELEKATDKFNESRILGQGGQGTVYKGMLTDGKIVAVKKSKVVDEENIEDFINEIIILSQINHKNIVKLLGCCLETEAPILVYEFVPNGNLSKHLHDHSDDFAMTWQVRLRIATEIAGALHYLHSTASVPVYHRDVKSTNMLLDDKYRAKISDFGTSRSITVEQTHLTTAVTGTSGYVDPEYSQSSQYTAKSDVYSFGVVLVELLTGQKPISVLRPQEGRILATYFIASMEEGKLFDILDARVREESYPEQVRAVAKLARRCLNLKGKNRPTMKEVAAELDRIQSPGKVSQFQFQDDKEVGAVETDTIHSCDSVCITQVCSASSSQDVKLSVPQKTW